MWHTGTLFEYLRETVKGQHRFKCQIVLRTRHFNSLQNQHYILNMHHLNTYKFYSLPCNCVHNGTSSMSQLWHCFVAFSSKHTGRTFVEMIIMEQTLSYNMLVNWGAVLFVELWGTSRDCDVRWKFNQTVSNSLVNNRRDRCDPLMKWNKRRKRQAFSMLKETRVYSWMLALIWGQKRWHIIS